MARRGVRKNKDEDMEPTTASETQNDSVGSLARMAGISADHPLLNFYAEDKADTFISQYLPCDELDPMADRYNEASLRAYFKAYVCTAGDPMKLYFFRLRMAGFHMRNDVSGEPVLYVKPLAVHRGSNAWMLDLEK